MSLSEQFQQIFGERIKSQRRKLGLTQHELSERLNISRTMLANIESGTQRTSVLLLARLAQTLEISVEDLVPGLPEAEAGLEQSRRISLASPNKPVLLSRELEALDISLDSGGTLNEALEEVRRQNHKSEAARKDGEENG